mmetsp:Transcript_45865/g.109211  ORF Transcript_45865/g.109211 Transcript_45865/m.109211 type:complete len:276 (+) Transcript_45865:50-877(+)
MAQLEQRPAAAAATVSSRPASSPLESQSFATAAADALIKGEDIVGNLSTAMVRLCERDQLSDLCAAIHQAAEQIPQIKEQMEVMWLADDMSRDVEAFLRGEADCSHEEDSPSAAAAAPEGEHEASSSSQGRGNADAVRELLRRTLVVAYLPRAASEDEVHQALAEWAQITRLRMPKDTGGNSKCFCFVECATEDEAIKLLNHCRDGKVVMTDAQSGEWQLRASRARRATAVAPAPARRRGTRGGKRHRKKNSGPEGGLADPGAAQSPDHSGLTLQ